MTPDSLPFDDPSADVSASLSPAEVRAVLAQDLRNILLKVHEKRPLTDREREIVRRHEVVETPDETADVCCQSDPCPAGAQEPKWAKTVVDLAAVLAVDRRTIGNWRQQSGCPSARSNGQFLVSEWRDFARKIGSPSAAAVGGGGPAQDDKRELENRKLRAEIEERELKLASRRGEYTANPLIGEQIAALVQEAVSVLRAKFERELPPEYNCDAAHNTALNKAAIDEVCDRLSEPLACMEVGAARVAGGDEDDE